MSAHGPKTTLAGDTAYIIARIEYSNVLGKTKRCYFSEIALAVRPIWEGGNQSGKHAFSRVVDFGDMN